MPAKVIMVQGTGSSVGKSLVVTALCRLLKLEGRRVAPFKSQNMSNNSFVTKEGGEIARAQAAQAEACEIEPSILMSPILLKPTSDTGSQVVVLGQPTRTMKAREYDPYKRELEPIVEKAFRNLAQQYDVIVIEGAGSPAEINLQATDLVNMRIARMTAAPVVLVGDIDKGGVFAQLAGTLELLSEEDRARVKGLIINKFRGDLSILQPGLDFIEKKVKKPVLGVLPYIRDCALSAEDSMSIPRAARAGSAENKIHIEVIQLPRLSNATDIESLEREPDVSLRFIQKPTPNFLPDVLIIPGSKSTMADLKALRESGLADYIRKCARAGVEVIGLCGGYQMMGQKILDPHKVEAAYPETDGLRLLECVTTFEPTKEMSQVRALHKATGHEATGYEIHMGRTRPVNGQGTVFSILERQGRKDDAMEGLQSEDGLVWGTYLHGLFDAPEFRRAILDRARARKGLAPLGSVEGSSALAVYDKIASVFRESIDMKKLLSILEGRA